MKIDRVKINGIQEPVGYDLETVFLSWIVSEAKGSRAENVRVEVAKTGDFSYILFHAEGKNLSCEGVNLDVSLEPRTRYFVKICVTDDTGDSAETVTFFETGKQEEAWEASWIGINDTDDFHPVFIRGFSCDKIVKARLYICGLGMYEAYLNGSKVGEEFLAPYRNDYMEHLQVQTYDVTDFLGEVNQLEIYLGNGWYKGRFGLDGVCFGEQFSLIAELHLTDKNGRETILGTDDRWEYFGSDIEDSGIYDGEFLNRQRWKNKENLRKKAVLLNDMEMFLLTDRHSLPIRIMEKVHPIKVLNTPTGETVLDMGQNFAGWLSFFADFTAGTKIHLEFGEVLQNGCFYNENYRSATKGFIYISDGRKEVVRPYFTYYGFRYVKVTGWPGVINPKVFTGCVLYSELEQTGIMETGHKKVNQLISNCLWGQKSNFVDLPTDCPQRDERLGWTGDAQVFAPTAAYNMDVRAFYHKYLWMMKTSQVHLNGGIAAYVPEGKGMCPICAVWGDAATFIPETLWKFYHDVEALKTYYPMMKYWVDYVSTKIKAHHKKRVGLWDFDFQFGDWLALDGKDEQSVMGGTATEYIASMYYYKSTEIVSEAAKILKRREEADYYSALALEQKHFLLDEYFTPHGHLSVTTQAAYIVAIQFDIYKDREVLTHDFLSLLAKDDYRIRCGFVGAPLLCQTLCKCGCSDLAYEFLLNEGFPGWMYCINLGATTIWERWNSILADGSISGTGMNSLNHFSYGSVVEFLYAYSAGIRSSHEGFTRAVLAPIPSIWLRSMHASYQSSAGKYVSEWEFMEDGRLKIHMEIPFGCTAMMTLPESDKDPFKVKSGSYDYLYMPIKDYYFPYKEECFLKHVFANPEARKVLLSKMPMAVAYDNEANAGKMIKDLAELAYAGTDIAVIQETLQELANVRL